MLSGLPRNLAYLAICRTSADTCRKTREALGVQLEGAVVIIDEAHNLLPAINGSHSVSLSSGSLSAIVDLLDAYLARFQGRLGGAKTEAVTSAKRLVERLLDFACSAAQVRVHALVL